MSEQPKKKSDREFENLIIDLCGIILVDSDTLNREEVRCYINSLSDNEIKNKTNAKNIILW